jgi:hypothetical protein
MRLLKCLLCEDELDIISELGAQKQVKCKGCGFTSSLTEHSKEPEVFIRAKRSETG